MSQDPVARYKAVVARLGETREQVRRWEQLRASELETELVAADERLRAAAARQERVRRSANQWWQAAQHVLRGKRWLRVGTLPGPEEVRMDGDVTGRPSVQQAYLALLRAARTSPWTNPRR